MDLTLFNIHTSDKLEIFLDQRSSHGVDPWSIHRFLGGIKQEKGDLSRDRYNVEINFSVLYFGWPNQPSSGKVRNYRGHVPIGLLFTAACLDITKKKVYTPWGNAMSAAFTRIE